MLRFKSFSVFVAALLLASSAFASQDAVSSINELPAIEIPAKAAEIVRSAPLDKQLGLSRSILTTVLKQRPQMAVQMVATLSKVAPDTAPVIAVIAASIVPQYGDVILRAAAASAPDKAEIIAATSGIFFPESRDLVIKAVSSAGPVQADSIAATVESIPQRFTASPVGQNLTGGGSAATINQTGQSIATTSPVTKTTNPLTGESVNLTPSGIDQLIAEVKENDEVSALELNNLYILRAVVDIKQSVEAGAEGFASVSGTDAFVNGVEALDPDRQDPVIKALLEKAKEEFIENKYNQ